MQPHPAHPTIALIGNPNCGKTELFNILANDNQRVGNWPGVTVDKIEGTMVTKHGTFNVVDLPGCYSLELNNDAYAIDEAIPAQFLHHQRPAVIINIVHALHLQRHLYLTLQVLETEIPTIIVVNMVDQLSDAQQLTYNAFTVATQCPVVPISAKYHRGIDTLFDTIRQQLEHPQYPLVPHLPPSIQASAMRLVPKLVDCSANPFWSALRLLEHNTEQPESWLSTAVIAAAKTEQQNLQKVFNEDIDIIQAELRYQAIEQWLPKIYGNQQPTRHSWTESIDRLLLNRWLGLPFFLMMMYLMFYSCLSLSQWLQEPLDTLTNLWLIEAPASLLSQHHLSTTIIHFYQQSLGTALCTTLSFIPILLLLFLWLNLLEHSGYMSRAAFVMDKIMGLLKLPGRAFVSLLIGFGCNVPAIMSTRTLSNQQDRIVTAMMSPFMSCSARLAVYAIFVQTFFHQHGQNIIFFIYLLGIGVAIITGLGLRFCCFPKHREPLILELPRYHRPSVKYAWRDSCLRVKNFLIRTFNFMLPACICLALLQNIPAIPLNKLAHQQSLLEQCARWLTPLLRPIGIEHQNWPATIALILGSVAKEVMIGALNTLYSNPSHHVLTLHQLLQQSLSAIKNLAEPFVHLSHALSQQPQASILTKEQAQVQTHLSQHFGHPASVIAFLIFTCLYVPCFSTIGAINKEFNNRWAWLATIWSLLIATICAMLFFQIATYAAHPQQTLVIVGAVLLSLVTCLLFFRAKRTNRWTET